MKKFFSKAVACVVVVGSCISMMGQTPIFAEQVVFNNEVKQAVTNYLLINNEVYVPFKWMLNEVGIKDFKWENGKKGSNTKAYITVDAPAYFWGSYYAMLESAFTVYDAEYEDTLTPLPESLKGFLKPEEEINNDEVKITTLNERPIELTVTSQGYETGEMIYNYKIIDGTLYVPVNEVKGYFGIDGVTIDKASNKAVLRYTSQVELQEQLQNEIAKLEQNLKLEKTEDVLAVWIRAQQTRNGALQYSMLCNDAKQNVLPEVKTRGWVTGGSSPTLRGGKVSIKNKEKLDDQTMRYTVTYESMLQGKVYENLEQVIMMKAYEEEGKTYWCISKVTGDRDYYTYESVGK